MPYTQSGLPYAAQSETATAEREPLPPINGSTPKSRHASYTGAVHAAETRSANIVALRQLWRWPMTINEAAVLMQLPVSSICSLKASIADELEVVDFEFVSWGAHRKPTKRCRWRIRT